MKAIKVEVTSDDIDRGLHCSVRGCALALAIQRAIPLAERVFAGTKQIHLHDFDGNWYLCLPPSSYFEFQDHFDGWTNPTLQRYSERPKPIAFHLEVPNCFLPIEPNRELGSGVCASLAPSDTRREPKSLGVDTLSKEEKMEQFL